jgi:hypothetical protein
VFPVRYKWVFHIPEDGILHSHSRENLKSYRDDITEDVESLSKKPITDESVTVGMVSIGTFPHFRISTIFV